MANETVKALLMILMFGSLNAAIRVPSIRASQRWVLVGRAIARAWSAIASIEHNLQPAVLTRGSCLRRLLS
jgi:hypothetical protein